jgi:hypothetical protein
MSKTTRNIIRIVVGACLLAACLHVYQRSQADRTLNPPMAQKIDCLNNLTQIGSSLKSWSLDHNGAFPWQVSTSAGGTMELRNRAGDGFDSNAPVHFSAMSYELSTPLILVCPQDRTAKPARSFDGLRPENVTYRLRTTTNTLETRPKEPILICPIDGNIVYSDGTVTGKAMSDTTNSNGSMRVQ